MYYFNFGLCHHMAVFPLCLSVSNFFSFIKLSLIQYDLIITWLCLFLSEVTFTDTRGYDFNIPFGGHYSTLSRRYNYLKCVWTQQQSFKLHEAKTDLAERRNRQTTITARDLNSPSQKPIELLDRKSTRSHWMIVLNSTQQSRNR